MKEDKKVSVVVPVFNTEMYVTKCIESLLKQTYTFIEIVIVDDASTDESLDCCKHIQETDERIKIISLQENSGVSNARNVGIGNSTGEYVIFVDSDDFVSENYIELLVSLQETYPDSMVMTLLQEFNEEKPIEGSYVKDEVKIYPKRQYLTTQYVYHPWACAAIFKKYILESNSIFFNSEAKFGEDAYFVNKYLCYCNNVIISQTRTYYYYVHSTGGAISREDKKYTSEDVVSRFSSYMAYAETVKLYEQVSPKYASAIKASYCFLAADILLMQFRANDQNSDITEKLKNVLNFKNIIYYLRNCKYTKHKLLVIGMKYFPKLSYKFLKCNLKQRSIG